MKSNIKGTVHRLLNLFLAIFVISTALPNRGDELKSNFFAFAHSHNDYENPRPLLDALENGFNSVEADVYLVGNELLVAHDFDKVQAGRSLSALYLEPLKKIISDPRFDFAQRDETFWLMIDIKSEGSSTYKMLHKKLLEYKSFLTDYSKIKTKAGELNPVSIVISGNRNPQLIANLKPSLAAFDARIKDIEKNDFSGPHVAWVSDNWANHFKWNGQGLFSESESKKLKSFSAATHNLGAKLRFWNIPDKPEVWEVLTDHGVDLINTDRLGAFHLFFSDK